MSQGKPSSLGSSLQNFGASLLYAHPVSGKNTFKPSGNPTDPPGVECESPLDSARRIFGLDTKAGRDAFDAYLSEKNPEYVRRSKEAGRHWEKIRFQTNKSPRARKRALEREARRSK